MLKLRKNQALPKIKITKFIEPFYVRRNKVNPLPVFKDSHYGLVRIVLKDKVFDFLKLVFSHTYNIGFSGRIVKGEAC